MTTPSSDDPPQTWDLTDRLAAAHEDARQAVRDQRKSLTVDEATDLVTTIFTSHGVPVTPQTAKYWARKSLDRFWGFKHPVQARREGWFNHPRG